MCLLMQILFVVLGISLFLVVYFNLMFVRYLQGNHHAVWEKLNKPSWAPSSSKKDSLLMKSFLNNQEYLELKDPKLNALVDQKKKISLFSILVFCLYAGMFLAFIIKR